MCTAHGKILAGEKLVNLENHVLFAKIFLAIIHRYTEAYALTNLFTNFFVANTSYLYGSPKFSRVWYFYLNTSESTCILLKYFSQNNATYLYLYFKKCQSTCTLLKYFHMYFAPCLRASWLRALATLPLSCTVHIVSLTCKSLLIISSSN